MKILIPILTFFFHMLEWAAVILVIPFALVCAAGLIGFTVRITQMIRVEREGRLPLLGRQRSGA